MSVSSSWTRTKDWASNSDDPNMLTFCLIPTSSLGDVKLENKHIIHEEQKISSHHISAQIFLEASSSLWEWTLQAKGAHRSQCSLCHTTLSDQQLSQRQPLPPPQVADKSPSFLLTPTSPDLPYQRLPKADQFPDHTTLHPDSCLHRWAPSCLSALS